MKLRKPCPHIDKWHPEGHYDGHVPADYRDGKWCDGGVFLPDDTLIIEKVDGEWPQWVIDRVYYEANDLAGQELRILDALSRGPE